MNKPTSAGKVAYGKLDEDVILTRVDNALALSILSVEKIDLLHAVIDAYLNTKPDAPAWLWTLSDALNPVSVPSRKGDWK